MVFEASKSGIRAAESLPEVMLLALIADAMRLSELLVASAVAVCSTAASLYVIVENSLECVVSPYPRRL